VDFGMVWYELLIARTKGGTAPARADRNAGSGRRGL